MERHAIIVAGGKGTRMGSETPKQFLPVHGIPILVHTIRAFLSADQQTQICLVLPEDQLERWSTIAVAYQLTSLQVTVGGATRFESVKNGLKSITEKTGLVAIHDAVRPCIAPGIINRCYQVAKVAGSAIVCVPSKDSLRKKVDDATVAVDRSKYYLVQTPQVFDIAMINSAYHEASGDHFTDDASVVEHAGHQMSLVEGDYKNIKITTPEDLLVAEAYLNP